MRPPSTSVTADGRSAGAHRLRERRQRRSSVAPAVDALARVGEQPAVLVGDPQQIAADALAVVHRHRRQRVRVVGRDGALEREVAGEQRRLAAQPLLALGDQGAEDAAGDLELALQAALDPAAHRGADHPQRRQQDGEDQHREGQEDLACAAAAAPTSRSFVAPPRAPAAGARSATSSVKVTGVAPAPAATRLRASSSTGVLLPSCQAATR